MLKCAGWVANAAIIPFSQVDFVSNFGPTVVQYAEGSIFMKSFKVKSVYRIGLSHTGFFPWISFMILYEVNRLWRFDHGSDSPKSDSIKDSVSPTKFGSVIVDTV